jgi:hypothetical protein
MYVYTQSNGHNAYYHKCVLREKRGTYLSSLLHNSIYIYILHTPEKEVSLPMTEEEKKFKVECQALFDQILEEVLYIYTYNLLYIVPKHIMYLHAYIYD